MLNCGSTTATGFILTMKRVPKYRLHKPTGQAVATFPMPGGKRKDFYLGKYGTPESRKAYTRLVAEASADGDVIAPAHPSAPPSVAEMLVRYLKHAERHYRNPETGEQTGEVKVLKDCIRILRGRYVRHAPGPRVHPALAQGDPPEDDRRRVHPRGD